MAGKKKKKKNTVATANLTAIDLLCAFVRSNFGVLGSIPREIKQSPSGTLISYASVAAGRRKNKICQFKAAHWGLWNIVQMDIYNGRFGQLSETFKFRPQTGINLLFISLLFLSELNNFFFSFPNNVTGGKSNPCSGLKIIARLFSLIKCRDRFWLIPPRSSNNSTCIRLPTREQKPNRRICHIPPLFL